MKIGPYHPLTEFDVALVFLWMMGVALVCALLIAFSYWSSKERKISVTTSSGWDKESRRTFLSTDALEFQEWVIEALDNLPEEFTGFLERCVFRINEENPSNYKEKLGKGKIALASCVRFDSGYGMPLSKRSSVITIFKNPILRRILHKDDNEKKETIRKILLHEISHHFGFDENQVRKLGL